ncbi:MAG: hypothetical protein HQL93_13230, partial [Magnetococcales bacterium]|nr:hypothetical protein [Magnetococcales bacterium]
SLNGHRWFYNAQSNYHLPMDDGLSFNLFAGLMGANEFHKSYYDNSGTAFSSRRVGLTQASLGGEMSKLMDNQYELFVNTSAEYDIRHASVPNKSYDPLGANVGGGSRFNFSDVLTGELAASVSFGRTDLEERSLTGNLRYEF